MTKTCNTCEDTKQVQEFSKASLGRDGYRNNCKKCRRARARLKRANFSDEQRRDDRSKKMKNRYGITMDDYDILFQEQEGLCAICEMPGQRTANRDFALVVDHDHETGLVRGLLCYPCNMGLGGLGDSAADLQRALRYLEGQ